MSFNVDCIQDKDASVSSRGNASDIGSWILWYARYRQEITNRTSQDSIPLTFARFDVTVIPESVQLRAHLIVRAIPSVDSRLREDSCLHDVLKNINFAAPD